MSSEELSAERTPRYARRADPRPADCDCLPTFEDLPCWPCYRDGFRTPNPDAESDGEGRARLSLRSE